MLGGLTAVLAPEDFIMHSSGPDPASDFPKDVIDHVSKERAIVTGYVTFFVGIAVCALGFFMKDLKMPEPHDNPA